LRRYIPVAVALILSLSLTARGQDREKAEAPADGTKYELRLARPSKVGDTFHIDATGATKSSTLLTVGDKEKEPVAELYGISLTGTIKVLEVSKSGAETRLMLKVDTCMATVNKQNLPLLPAGTELVARWDKDKRKTVFELGDKPLPDDVGELLDLVVNTSDPESASDDEIFGTKEKRAVGDTWPINADAAAKELGRIGLKVKPEDLYGESTIAEQTRSGEVPSLVVKTEFKARSLTSDDKADRKVAIRSGSLRIETSVTLPVDPALPPSKSSMTMTLTRELVGTNDAGEEVRAVESSERRAERTIRATGK